MARHHFHLTGGLTANDAEGQDLQSLDAARAVAVGVPTERLRANSALLWRHGRLSVVAADDTGLTLFTVDMTTTNPTRL